MENVAVIGASHKPERYSYKAVEALRRNGHIPIPVARDRDEVLGFKAYGSISETEQNIDTVTIYVRPSVLKQIIHEIIEKSPKRVIMNPGTESEELKKEFEKAGIKVVQACTLVMLSTGQF